MIIFIKILNIVLIISSWSLLGMGIVAYKNLNEDYLNPIYIYKKFDVGYLVCVLLTIFFNLLCPIYSILYWIGKLLDIGKKK